MIIRAVSNVCIAMSARAAEPTRVVVCSKNPVKVGAVRSAFGKAFPEKDFDFVSVTAESGVGDQPFGDKETLAGARNRIKHSLESHPSSLVVALEGGVAWDHQGELECFAWALIRSPQTGAEGRARSATFVLPPAICELVLAGKELGDADDEVFGRENSGQGNGTIGRLTGNLITREAYYEHTTLLALAPFMHPDLYPKHLM